MKNNDQITQTKFQVLGYFEEYFIDGKFIGTLPCQYDSQRQFGWFGRKTSYATEDIILERGKKIKAGTKYYTYVQQLCGKFQGSQEEKVNAIQQSQAWKLRAKSTS